MSRIAYVDAVGGAAGDMLLAALVDAGANLERVQAAVDAVFPERYVLSARPVKRAGLRARFLEIEARHPADRGGRAEGNQTVAGLLAQVHDAGLDPRVSETACHVLTRLGEAEAAVHGQPVSEVMLHELGDDDTLVDVVGVSAALADLGVERIVVSTLPLGTGTVAGDHGRLPVPAPATLELLTGFEVRPGDGQGETVTPTAAAILVALGGPGEAPRLILRSVGYGAGTRDPEAVPNVVRVVIGDGAEEAPEERADDGLIQRDLVLVESNVDDLSPELVADAVDALLRAGAMDAWTTPIVMKKGRPAMTVAALCVPELEDVVRRVFFESTSTFGVRRTAVRRHELARRVVTVTLPDGQVRVKLGILGGRVITATPEHDDVAALAKEAGRPVRAVYEEAAVAAAVAAREGIWA